MFNAITSFILGVEAFGLIHLTQNMINYLSVITASLSAVVVVRFFLWRLIKGKSRSGLSLILFRPVLFFIDQSVSVLSVHVTPAGEWPCAW
ncbi:hypothetical protein ACEQPO_25490 [Bacillus sp. SL00103]